MNLRTLNYNFQVTFLKYTAILLFCGSKLYMHCQFEINNGVSEFSIDFVKVFGIFRK